MYFKNALVRYEYKPNIVKLFIPCRCDGESECEDYSDEEHCDVECNPNEHKCDNKCIEKKSVCDFYDDCDDKSDEWN